MEMMQEKMIEQQKVMMKSMHETQQMVIETQKMVNETQKAFVETFAELNPKKKDEPIQPEKKDDNKMYG